MKTKIWSIVLVSGLLIGLNASAQKENPAKPVHTFFDLTGAIGSGQGSVAGSYVYNFKTGKKKKFELGLGLRFTSYFGSNQNFTTAPAKLTSGKTGPAVFFSDNIPENIDTLFFNKPQINSLNLSFNFGYHFTPKFLVGFNIDAIGFSFGGSKTATYLDGNNINPPTAKPTGFNLLLISDNDLGSLNSEFFGTYQFSKNWSAKAGYQFLFTEYTTDQKVQTTPDGQKNDRFRNKMSAIAVGLVYHF